MVPTSREVVCSLRTQGTPCWDITRVMNLMNLMIELYPTSQGKRCPTEIHFFPLETWAEN